MSLAVRGPVAASTLMGDLIPLVTYTGSNSFGLFVNIPQGYKHLVMHTYIHSDIPPLAFGMDSFNTVNTNDRSHHGLNGVNTTRGVNASGATNNISLNQINYSINIPANTTMYWLNYSRNDMFKSFIAFSGQDQNSTNSAIRVVSGLIATNDPLTYFTVSSFDGNRFWTSNTFMTIYGVR